MGKVPAADKRLPKSSSAKSPERQNTAKSPTPAPGQSSRFENLPSNHSLITDLPAELKFPQVPKWSLFRSCGDKSAAAVFAGSRVSHRGTDIYIFRLHQFGKLEGIQMVCVPFYYAHGIRRTLFSPHWSSLSFTDKHSACNHLNRTGRLFPKVRRRLISSF